MVLVTATVETYSPASIPVFFVSGQSNAGELADLIASPLTGIYADMDQPVTGWQWAKETYGDEADETPNGFTWQALEVRASNFIGFEMGLGHAMRTAGQLTGAIVKWNVDGSSLDWWEANAKAAQALAFFQAQLATLGAAYYPAGIVWSQGESETTVPDTISAWKSRLSTIVALFRAGLGRLHLPVYVIQSHTANGIDVYQGEWCTEDRHAALITTPAYDTPNPPHWSAGNSVCEIGAAIAAAAGTPP